GIKAGRAGGAGFGFGAFREGGTATGISSSFAFPPSPAFSRAFTPAVSRAFTPAVSRVLSATRGCQPTVRIPSAERANRPTIVPPAVPTAWWTTWANRAGTSPASFCVGLQAAYADGKPAPVTVPIP